MAKVTETIDVEASPGDCYRVITDYRNYPKFLKETKQVVVGKKTENSVEVTFAIEVIKKISYTLKMIASPPTSVKWNLVSGDVMKKNSGEWQLKDNGNGTTRATYTVDVEFGIFVPGMISKMLVGRNLPTMLKAFKKRIEEQPGKKGK